MPKRREETPSEGDDTWSSPGSPGEDEPTAAQWIDEDDLDGMIDSEEDEFDEDREEATDETSMKRNLSHLSFGALAKATKELRPESEDSSSELSERGSDGDQSRTSADDDFKASSSRPPSRSNPYKRVKRPDKHAPMEVSSKKPVSRRRTVVDTLKIERRDPRFSSLSGSFEEAKFSKSYGFITSIQENEVAELRSSLVRARKLLTNSPAHLRDERGEEVVRLERALKRTESNVERTKREKRNREVLSKAKHEENKKQTDGKGAWHMKKSEQKKLLTEARFEELAKEGKGAVRKAITKRRLKVSQREKRSRPDGPGRGSQAFSAGAAKDDYRNDRRNKKRKLV